VISQTFSPHPGARHGFLKIPRAGDLENHRSVEGNLHEFSNQPAPLDAPLPRREVFIAVTLVVMHMKHPQIRPELENQIVEITGQKGMAGV
jgi:hypothetical protein